MQPGVSQLLGYDVDVGSEEGLAAIALLELSPVVRADAEQFTEWARGDGRYTYTGDGEDRVSTFHPSPRMDWAGWAADVELHGRDWSSTEGRLYKIIAALTTGAEIQLAGILDRMDSWEADVWRILVEWGTGGNNREHPGRYTAAVRQPVTATPAVYGNPRGHMTPSSKCSLPPDNGTGRPEATPPATGSASRRR